MSFCELTGTVKDYNGSDIRAGSQLTIFRVLPDEDSTTVFGTHKAVHVLKSDGTWFPAIQIERKATAYIYLAAPGFDMDSQNGSPLAIPDASSATIQSLAAAVSLPSQVPIAVPGPTSLVDYAFLLSNYASFALALAAAEATGGTLMIDSDATVSVDTTVNVELLWDGQTPAKLTVASGKTLIVKSSARRWPLRQLFAGSGSVKFGHAVTEDFPQWFGAAMNGSTDDAAAAQKAIDAWQPAGGNAPRAGIVTITGPMAIGSILTMQDNPVTLRGKGGFGSGGYASENAYNTYIKSLPALAGSPMILAHTMGPIIEHLALIGDSAHKPSAAIELSESGGHFSDMACVRDVWIGPMYGWADDTGTQFTRGIYFSGTVDSDTNVLSRVTIRKCVTGIETTNPNASIDHFDTVLIDQCTTGLKTAAPQVLLTNFTGAGNDVDIELTAQGCDILLINYVSEGSGRMLLGSATAPLRVVAIGGGFQADGAGKFAALAADYSGKRAFIKFAGLAATATYIELRGFTLQQVSSPATPVIWAWNSTDGTTVNGATFVQLKLEGTRGISTDNIAVGDDNIQNSCRIIELNAQPYSGVPPQMTRFIQSGVTSNENSFEDARFDLLGKANVFGGPLQVKKLRAPAGFTATMVGGGSGTLYEYMVTALARDGETEPSSVFSVSGRSSLDASHYVQIFGSTPTFGAYAFKIYKRVGGSGSYGLIKTLTLAEIQAASGFIWNDTGAVSPGAAPPSANTTGNATVEGGFKVRSLSGAPTPDDLPAGYWGVFLDTGSGNVRVWYNDGGSMISTGAFS